MNLLPVDTKCHHLQAEIWLTPIWHSEPPVIELKFNDWLLYIGPLTQARSFIIDQYLLSDNQNISVTFKNKKDSDTIPCGDKAVRIDKIVFNNINSDRFVWAGKYMPIYPNPWAGEQLAQGIVLDPILRYHNYLSWNGTWSLDFTVPIFTWIHTIEDLGWVYR